MPAGQYRIHADTTALKNPTPMGIMVLQGLGDASPVRIEAGALSKELHYSGDRVEIRVRVVDHDRLIPNPAITGSVTTIPAAGKPTRTPVPLTLRPAGDGTFLTTLPWTEAADYRVSLEARGKRLNGKDFHEGMSYTESIQQLRVRLLGLTDHPGKADNHGQIDHIAVDVRLRAGVAGHYLIEAHIISAGRNEAYGSKVIDLTPGETTVPVDVPVMGLGGRLNLEGDGPYTITVSIDEARDDIHAYTMYERPLTAQSQPYKLSSFSRGPIYLTGAVSHKLISVSGQPPYDALELTLDAVTPGGVCNWGANLGTVKSQTATVFRSGTLVQGPTQLKLKFDKWELSKVATLTTFTGFANVSCGSQQATLEKPFTIPAPPPGSVAKAESSFELRIMSDMARFPGDKAFTGIITLTPRGFFDAPFLIVVDPMPQGITLRDLPATPIEVNGRQIMQFHADVAPTVKPGIYPITIRIRNQDIERSGTTRLVIK